MGFLFYHRTSANIDVFSLMVTSYKNQVVKQTFGPTALKFEAEASHEAHHGSSSTHMTRPERL